MDQVIDRVGRKVANFVGKLEGSRGVFERIMALWRFIERPAKDVPRKPIPTRLLTYAFRAGAAQEADFIDAWQAALIDVRSAAECTHTKFRFLDDHPAGSKKAEYQQMVDRYVDQTIDVLLAKKSDATEDAIKIGSQFLSVRGIDNLFRLLKAVGKKKLKRLKSHEQTKVAELICQLIARSIPSPDETLAAFSEKVNDALKDKWLTKERLIELSFYAPQWAGWIEKTLDVPGLEDAALWFSGYGGLSLFMEYNLTNVSSDPEKFPSIAKAPPEGYDDQWLAKRSQLGRHQDFEMNPEWHIDIDWF